MLQCHITTCDWEVQLPRPCYHTHSFKGKEAQLWIFYFFLSFFNQHHYLHLSLSAVQGGLPQGIGWHRFVICTGLCISAHSWDMCTQVVCMTSHTCRTATARQHPVLGNHASTVFPAALHQLWSTHGPQGLVQMAGFEETVSIWKPDSWHESCA